MMFIFFVEGKEKKRKDKQHDNFLNKEDKGTSLVSSRSNDGKAVAEEKRQRRRTGR